MHMLKGHSSSHITSSPLYSCSIFILHCAKMFQQKATWENPVYLAQNSKLLSIDLEKSGQGLKVVHPQSRAERINTSLSACLLLSISFFEAHTVQIPA